MLEGITVLTQRTIGDNHIFSMIITSIGVLIVLSAIIITAMSLRDKCFSEVIFSTVLVAIIGCLTMYLGLQPEPVYNIYEVTIDKSVSYVGLTDQYTVIQQKDGVYTIRDKFEKEKEN